MNYTVQKRIKEIIEILDQIINNINRDVRKIGLDKPNFEKRRHIYRSTDKFFDSEIAWEEKVLEKTKQLKVSIQTEYYVELKELEKKEALIHEGLDTWNPKFDEIRSYFYDEHFLLNFFHQYPYTLLEFGQIIIVSESINWKPTFLKLANILIESSNCDIEDFENFIKHMNSSEGMEREIVEFLFSPERFNKKDLEQKMKSNYERFLKIDSYIFEGVNTNHKTELVNDLELVLSSLINSKHGYNNIPDEFNSNELVYLFAAFNSSSTFKNAQEDIRSNEAIVNYAFNIDKFKVNESHNQIENRALQKLHLENIYPYASEEIRANQYIANMAAI